MNETGQLNHCERAGELVAYFYGEASRAERESFNAHLARCGACRDELAGFAEVRGAVGHWRAEILRHAPASSLTAAQAPEAPRENVSRAVVPRRTAQAALREFFTLSPLWLRAGLAAAALSVCALVALAAVNAEVRLGQGGLAFSTRLRRVETQTAPPAQVSAREGKVYTQAELSQLVAERDAALRELADTRAQLDDSRAVNLIDAVEAVEPVSESGTISTPGHSRRERRAAPVVRPQRSRREREEEDAPRLYDLLSEAN